MKIEFFFLLSGGSFKTVKASTPRKSDITVWHKISIRVQDNEKLIRFYVDDTMINVQKFDYKLKAIPSDSQLRLAQAYEIVMEGTAEIRNKFNGVLQDVKISLGPGNCKSPTAAPQPVSISEISSSPHPVSDFKYYFKYQQVKVKYPLV